MYVLGEAMNKVNIKCLWQIRYFSYCIIDIEFDRPLISIPDLAIFSLALFNFLNFDLILADSRYFFAI